MKTNKRKVFSFGGVLVAFGALARIIQLALTCFGATGLSSWKPLYILMLCLMTGGFAVIAYENQGKASFFAIAAAAACLLSTVMGNMSDGKDFFRVLSAAMLVLLFASSGAVMLCTRDRPGGRLRMTAGVIMILLALAVSLLSSAFFNAASVFLYSLLFTAYAVMGAGLI